DIKLHWFAQPELKIAVLPKFIFWSGIVLGYFLDFFANLSPYFCSRFWCYWVGGFEEISFVFKVKK
ncbi:MAG: class I SAM-dependent methyltransferase, partial [Candidatus Kariarchaeaceae archaeon]